MAIFHLSTRTSRIPKAGKSVNAANHYAYITRQGKYSALEDLTYMETGRLPHCEEIRSYKDFWEAADEYKRKNGRTYREVTLGLQEEFTKEENIELVQKFLDHFGIRDRQAYVLAIHDKQVSYDVHHRNVHCHIMFNERIVTDRKFKQASEVFKQWAGPIKQNERGGLQVDRYFTSREFVRHMRDYWEEINNEKFEEIGLETRISSKSLKEQRENLIAEGRYEEAEALNREPAKHMGPAFKYPDVQEEVMAMVNEIENERTEDQRLAEEQVVATLKRKGISCEGMEYDTENKKNEFDEEKTESTSNDTTIENKKISRETFERLVSLQYQKLQDERRVKREEKKQAHANENLSKQIFELKKEIMAEDIILRRAVKRAQLDKAELDKRRYQKIMYQLKKYGFDESIATDGVIITVHDICKELGELKKREWEKVSQLEEKIQKRNERVQINTPDEVLAMDRLTDGEYSKTVNKLNGLNDEIKELRKVTRAPVEDVKDYLAKCKEEDTITKKRDQAQEIIDKQLAKAHGGLKWLYDSYLDKIAKEKKIAEKYNEGDRKAIRKHQQLADLLDERRKALAKELPKEKILYGENIPSKVYLTYKINGKEIKRMPFVADKDEIYFIVNKPQEPQFGKQIQVRCVKLGEEAPEGKAKVYEATVLVEQKRLEAKGVVVPLYIPLAVTPTKETVLLYGIDNPESRVKLNPRSPNGKGRSIKIIAGNKAPRITMGPQGSYSRGQSALVQLLQNSVAGTATIRDKVQPDEKSADRRSAEAAKCDDVTKDMALENELLENGEWVQQMRQTYGRRR